MKNATVIPLDVWQDPQNDVILIFSEHECSIYFACWRSAGEPANFIGHISFDRVRGVRSYPREYTPYQISEPIPHSYILQIRDSELVREHIEFRERHYPNSALNVEIPTHYVVLGHDVYHEILASSFKLDTILNESVKDPRLLRLIGNG